MFYVSKRIEIAGAHQLNLPYQSKCSNLHGHNWKITVFCKAEKVNEDGMVCDFTKIKDIVCQLDHQNLNDCFSFNPTAENIAHWLCSLIPNCYRVEVQESEGNIAIYEKG